MRIRQGHTEPVISVGRQFDRLGTVYLGDVEVFRTSVAEPTAPFER